MPRAPRTLQACQGCRYRKIRCDGARPVCLACKTRKRECQWPEKPVPGSFRAFGTLGNEDSPAQVIRVVSTPPLPAETLVFRQYEPTGQLPTPVSGTRSSSHVQAGSPDLPPAALLQRILAMFFDRHHTVELCSCIDEASLTSSDGNENGDKDGKTRNNSNNRALLHAVLSLGALYISDDEAAADRRFASAEALSKHYLRAARAASRDTFDQPSIASIQLNLCLGLRELLAASATRAWLCVGLAIRLAEALRMRTECNECVSFREREIRRRTFWSCVVLDRLVAYCTFRAQAIDADAVNIHLPCDDILLAFGRNKLGPKLKDLGPASAQAGEGRQREEEDAVGRESRRLTTWLLPYFVKTVVLWGNITSEYIKRGRAGYTLSPHDPQSAVWQCQEELLAWVHWLPSEVQWTEANLRAHRLLGQESLLVQMHLLISHGLCMAHQEYLTHAPVDDPELTAVDRAGVLLSGVNADSISTCLDNARHIAGIASTLTAGATTGELANSRSHHCRPQESIICGVSMLTAASILMWLVYASEKTAPGIGAHAKYVDYRIHEAEETIAFLRATIKGFPRQADVARTWATSLRLLKRFYRVHYCDPEDVPSNQQLQGEGGGDTPPAVPLAACPLGISAEYLQSGSGAPHPANLPKGLFYKVRLVVGLAMELPDLLYRHIVHRRKQQPVDPVPFDSADAASLSLDANMESEDQVQGIASDGYDFTADLPPSLSWLLDFELDLNAPLLWTDFSESLYTL